MGLVTDRTDPRLGHGSDDEPTGQNEVYLVLSTEERQNGYTRPYRDTYKHVGEDLCGQPSPAQNKKDSEAFLCSDRRNHEGECRIFAPASSIAKRKSGCGTTTTMGHAIAETYARDPKFYGSTYCVQCKMHRPLAEFVWLDGSRVGA